jgi:hypothetical protein
MLLSSPVIIPALYGKGEGDRGVEEYVCGSAFEKNSRVFLEYEYHLFLVFLRD